MKIIKNIFSILLFSNLLFSCKDKVDNIDNKVVSKDKIVSEKQKQYVWSGVTNGKKIILHYIINENLAIGEIIYDSEKPQKLIGTIENNNKLKFLEFDKKGNINSVIKATVRSKSLKCNIFTNSFSDTVSLEIKDTILNNLEIKQQNNLEGEYFYSYGKFKNEGSISLNKIKNSSYSFDIFSTANGEAPNIAEVSKDTVIINKNKYYSSFVYTIPESNNCGFIMKIYNDFLYVKYTNGYCDGQFGMNATIDGIFIKIDN